MKNNTLLLKENQAFTYKPNHRKGGVTACLLVVLATYGLFVAGALWWDMPLFFNLVPLLFLLAGALHIWIVNKNLRHLAQGERWLYTGVLAIALLVLLASALLWQPQLSLLTILAGAGAFLLPFTLAELWHLYNEVSFGYLIPWQATASSAEDYPSAFLTGLPVRFRIIQEPDHSNKSISFLASARMPLSAVFLDMVQKQEAKGVITVPLKGWENESYTWVFYTRDLLLWFRALDPGKSLRENNVRKNATVFARRVSGAAFRTADFNETKTEKQ